MNYECRRKNIYELCNVERAVAGKLYKAGSCYIKLSAVDEFVGQLHSLGEIDTRYAVLEPKKEMNFAYLYIAICRSFPEFLAKYRTTINLQFKTLQHFEVYWHNEKDVQNHIVEAINKVDREVELIQNQISREKEVKRWYLAKMMV